jgi:hypothetical protein
MVIFGLVVALLWPFAAVALQPAPVPPEEGPFVIPAMSLDKALTTFHAVCMAPFPDPARFEAAVRASGLPFARTGAGEGGLYRWSDPHRSVRLQIDEPLSRGRSADSCRFRVAIREQLTAGQIMDRIGLDLVPDDRLVVTPEDWGYWPLGGNLDYRLEYLPASPDTRLFSLQLVRVKDPQGK